MLRGSARVTTVGRRCFSELGWKSKELYGDPTRNTGDEGSWEKMTLSRAMFRVVGWQDGDFRKPLITVAAPYTNANPCNDRVMTLAHAVVEAIEAEGGKAVIAPTPVISDGITQGSPAMRYSLISRDYIADCIEIMHEGYMCDAMITLCGCDKTVPGAAMPIPRHDSIGLSLYAGTALPGQCEGCVGTQGQAGLDPGSLMESIGAYGRGKIDKETFEKYEKFSLPGSGTCSAMFTANSMASAIEALGLSLPNSASNPVVTATNELNPDKLEDCKRAAKTVMALLKNKTSSRQILTMEAFHNAITVVYALGGSTNAVLHLLALAKEADVPLKIEDFNDIGSKVPLLGNLSPHGIYHMSDLGRVGGVPALT